MSKFRAVSMADTMQVIASSAITAPHGFLDRQQSDRMALDLVGGEMPTVFVKQVHSADALAVTAPFPDDARPEVDAMVTDIPGLRLAIVTADCAPVLLHDPQAGVIGAAHAGWRGALGGVIENTVARMAELGAQPANIRAAIGPCIAQPSYEVDAAMRDLFDASDGQFFASGRAGHYQFDLEGYVAMRCARAGIGQAEPLGIDTYAHPARFHSYRRATHREEPTQGRQISVIALRQT